MRSRLLAAPADGGAWRDLGFAWLQTARETADPGAYERADAAFTHARVLRPDDVLVLVGIGGLQLARHEFESALMTGRDALVLAPDLPPARAVVADALVELGRYDEADAEVAAMLAVARDVVSLTRASYLRELHGDLTAAVSLMDEAAAAPAATPENTAYVQVLRAGLLVLTGDRVAAARAYDAALELVPGYAPALAGQGRLAVGVGDLDDAARLFEQATGALPLPEYVVALGDVHDAAGRTEASRDAYDVARAEARLFEAAGVVVDLDLALFEADHGDAGRAVRLASAAYSRTPSIRAADALAWALFRDGRRADALARSAEALRLGTLDPLIRFHAGAIAVGMDDEAARGNLELALRLDPGFSASGATRARQLLVELDSSPG